MDNEAPRPMASPPRPTSFHIPIDIFVASKNQQEVLPFNLWALASAISLLDIHIFIIDFTQ